MNVWVKFACFATAIVLVISGGAIARSSDISFVCNVVGPAERIHWVESVGSPGLSTIRDGFFRYDLDAYTQHRLISARIKEIEDRAKLHPSVNEDVLSQERDFYTSRATQEVASNVRRSICFDAVRIDLRRYKVEVIDALNEIDSRPSTAGGVKKIVQADGEYGLLPADYDVETLLASEKFKENLVALTSGGWSTGVSRPEPVGYLKVQGETVSRQFFPDLTAILCVEERPVSKTQVLSYISVQRSGELAPHNWEESKFDQLETCKDAIQIGPRVVELDNSEFVEAYRKDVGCILQLGAEYSELSAKIGICESSLNLPPRRRVVIAADFGFDGQRALSGDTYLYLFYFKSDVSLFGIQKMLLESSVVSDKVSLWALNLAGDNQSFFALMREDGTMEMRSPNSSTTSGIAIRRR